MLLHVYGDALYGDVEARAQSCMWCTWRSLVAYVCAGPRANHVLGGDALRPAVVSDLTGMQLRMQHPTC